MTTSRTGGALPSHIERLHEGHRHIRRIAHQADGEILGAKALELGETAVQRAEEKRALLRKVVRSSEETLRVLTSTEAALQHSQALLDRVFSGAHAPLPSDQDEPGE